MTIKLNSSHREAIAAELIGDLFERERRDIEQALSELAMSIYHEAYTKEERDLMESLPAGWLPTTKHIRAELGGEYESLNLPKGVTSVRVPYDRQYTQLKVGARHELCKQYRSLKDRMSQCDENERNLRIDIMKTLRSVTTAKKLVEIWPQISKVVEKVVQAPISRELAPIDTSRLNKELGLVSA